MQVEIKFIGVQTHEQTPELALYAIDARGAAKKLVAGTAGKLDLGNDPGRHIKGIIAIGPNVPDPGKLDAKLLVKFSAAQELPTWEKNPVVEIPAQWWRQWLHFTICLAGKVSKCFPFFFEKTSLLKGLALGRIPFPPIERCYPICNGVVEVWESTCCCFPFLISDVPSLIAKLKAFLTANPVMFPPAPRPDPDPGPIDRLAEKRVNRAIAAGNVDLRFAPNPQLHQDLQVLEASSQQEAVQYFVTHPSLWPIWCRCTSSQLGDAALQPDGSFQFCFEQFPFILWNCYRSYFYKVYQQQNGQLVCIYDGAAAHQYFAADDFANLSTLSGSACTNPQPIPGTDFVVLQQIGATSTHTLHSNYGVPDASGNDTTQTGPYSVATPPVNGGLVNANDAPWCKTLDFMLYFDPGMQGLGAYYYRMSVAPADLNGNPVGTMQPLQNAIAWSKYALGTSGVETDPQTLGPQPPITNSVGAFVQDLYVIPYNSATIQPVGSTSPDQDWEPGQFHQYFDTTTLNPSASPPPGPGNGRFLVAVEIFNSGGDRMVPPGVTPEPGDVAVSFEFLRLMPILTGAGSTTTVPFAALTHLIWADNRPVVGEIDNFNLAGSSSAAECQFLTGDGDEAFQVGYRAYHAVLGDPNPPNPLPPSTFMSSFVLWWERGLNGGTGTLDSGADSDQPPTRGGGSPELSPAANGLLSTLLPNPLPPATIPVEFPIACSFAIELDVYSKHTDGTYHYDDLDAHVLAAVALSRTS
jgi:hypothetical protein